jgi:hypothetical protein
MSGSVKAGTTAERRSLRVASLEIATLPALGELRFPLDKKVWPPRGEDGGGTGFRVLKPQSEVQHTLVSIHQYVENQTFASTPPCPVISQLCEGGYNRTSKAVRHLFVALDHASLFLPAGSDLARKL